MGVPLPLGLQCWASRGRWRRQGGGRRRADSARIYRLARSFVDRGGRRLRPLATIRIATAVSPSLHADDEFVFAAFVAPHPCPVGADRRPEVVVATAFQAIV